MPTLLSSMAQTKNVRKSDSLMRILDILYSNYLTYVIFTIYHFQNIIKLYEFGFNQDNVAN